MEIPPTLRPLPPEGVPGPGRLGSGTAYGAAVVLSVVAILSQYFVPELLPPLAPVYATFLGSLAVVYGLPIALFAVLVGARPLARWSANSGVAAWEGVRWYALLALLGLLISGVLLAIYQQYDRAAIHLLDRPNPVLVGARSNPWFFVAFSFVVGVVEETIFRGWIFGYWLARGTRHWAFHAAWTSALFAAVHLYYGGTYGIIAPVIYPTLFLMGFAFAAAMRASGGNLWVVAGLHGMHDAGAFLSLVSPSASVAVLLGAIAIGLLIALLDVLGTQARPGPSYYGTGSPAPGSYPGPPAPFGSATWGSAPPPWPPPGLPPPPPPSSPPPPPPDR